MEGEPVLMALDPNTVASHPIEDVRPAWPEVSQLSCVLGERRVASLTGGQIGRVGHVEQRV